MRKLPFLTLLLVSCASADTDTYPSRGAAPEPELVEIADAGPHNEGSAPSLARYSVNTNARPDAEPPTTFDAETLARSAYLAWGLHDPRGASDAPDDPTREPQRYLTLAFDGEGNVLGRASRPHFVVGGRVVRFDIEEVAVGRVPCATFVDDDVTVERDIAKALVEESERERKDLAAEPMRVVDRASFVDVTTGERIVVADFAPGDATNDFAFSASLEATLGAHAFMTTFSWSYGCGAHGSGGRSAHVFDLSRAGLAVDVEPVAELAPGDLDASRPEAERSLQGLRAEWGGESDAIAAQFVELRPHYDRAGALSAYARFVAGAPYAFSTGWGSYSIDAFAKLPRVPATWPTSTPEVVARVARAEPSFALRGVSGMLRAR